jgi:PAS domain S-box-containing protein
MEDISNTIELFASDAKLLSRLLETMGDALFVVDADRNIVYWNQQAEKLTGFVHGEVIGRHCLAGIRCQTCLYKCALFEKGEVRNVQITLRTKDGGTLYCTKNAFVLKSKDGQIIGAVEFLRDETRLVQQINQCGLQRKEIEERESLQRAVLSSIKEGVITIDPDFRVTSISPRAQAIMGITSSGVAGRFCHEIIGSDLCRKDCPARHCFDSGDPDAERSTLVSTASGVELSIFEMASVLSDEQGQVNGAALIIEDRGLSPSDPTGQEADFSGMVGRSPIMKRLFATIQQVAPTEASVLITGESGTGKEMVAQAIHSHSKRKRGPFRAINCAALPETLLESELFGHAKGAFTGAVRDKPGFIESATGGTLLLDEIGEMPLALQSKLLRFLQEREIQRIGESKIRKANVRVLSATNRDLVRAVEEGDFRQDLLYRIKVIPIHLPPLRERKEDIWLLASTLLTQITQQLKLPDKSLTPSCVERLSAYLWPGNIRELINALQYAATLSAGRRIRVNDLPVEIKGGSQRYNNPSGAKDEKSQILSALKHSVNNRSAAARLLGMNRVTLYRKMKKYGIDHHRDSS